MDINIIITIISTFLGGSSVVALIFERRKRRAEASISEADAKGKDLDNQAKENSIYKEMLDDLGNRYEKKFNEVTEIYERKIKLLEDEIKHHKTVILQLKKEINELKRKIKELSK